VGLQYANAITGFAAMPSIYHSILRIANALDPSGRKVVGPDLTLADSFVWHLDVAL